jgi:hypothetical protein
MHVNLKKQCKTNWSFKPEKGRTKVRKKDAKKRNLTHQEAEFV